MGGMRVLDYESQGAPSATGITSDSESSQWTPGGSRACCRRLFAAFASGPRNPLHSEFCRDNLSLQEPFGDPRPQAFFFRGSASAARRRDAALVAPALLGLLGLGG